ncbi:hypothetical protein AQUSIP_25970 [Aquicella siphonis]|uniref:Uncharacterized protein n=1 Tax=Aquicella siphonis TaxID=254247 RepID=A0A5E4PJP9_9COXI|nr:hypothetical protein [Aquicella siphonis]VVC77270.1 hypothetical protein AQUSIP_25970 [Aquicella siphonis]
MSDVRFMECEPNYFVKIQNLAESVAIHGLANVLNDEVSRFSRQREEMMSVLEGISSCKVTPDEYGKLMEALFSGIIKNSRGLAQVVEVLSRHAGLESFIPDLIRFALDQGLLDETADIYDFLIYFASDDCPRDLMRRMAAIIFGPEYLSKFISVIDDLDEFLSRLAEAFPFINFVYLLEVQELAAEVAAHAYTPNAGYLLKYLGLVENSMTELQSENSPGTSDTFYLLSRFTEACLSRIGPGCGSYDPDDPVYKKMLNIHFMLLRCSSVNSLQDLCTQYIQSNGFFSRNNPERQNNLSILPTTLLNDVLLPSADEGPTDMLIASDDETSLYVGGYGMEFKR